MDVAVELVIAYLAGFLGWLLLGERLFVPWIARLSGEEGDESKGPGSGAAA